MGIRFLSCAEGELAEAVEYYNEQSPGLGYDFIAEVKKTFTRIADYPNAWPSISKRTRRFQVPLRSHLPAPGRRYPGGGGHAYEQAPGKLEGAGVAVSLV